MHFYLLWQTSPPIPVADVQAVLDAIEPPPRFTRSRAQRRTSIEAIYLFDAFLVRALDEGADGVDGPRLWRWLRTRQALIEGTATIGTSVKDTLAQHQPLLLACVAAAADALIVDDQRWRFLHDLRSATLHLIDEDDLLAELFACLRAHVD